LRWEKYRYYLPRQTADDVDESLSAGIAHVRTTRLLVVALQFDDERTATRFERYLKTGSGRAFTKRRFE
jgi:hypothetical protein